MAKVTDKEILDDIAKRNKVANNLWRYMYTRHKTWYQSFNKNVYPASTTNLELAVVDIVYKASKT